MNGNQRITIGLLIGSAIVLSILVIGTMTEPAEARTMGRQGTYIMVGGHVGEEKEVVYVVNVPARRMNAEGSIDVLSMYSPSGFVSRISSNTGI